VAAIDDVATAAAFEALFGGAVAALGLGIGAVVGIAVASILDAFDIFGNGHPGIDPKYYHPDDAVQAALSGFSDSEATSQKALYDEDDSSGGIILARLVSSKHTTRPKRRLPSRRGLGKKTEEQLGQSRS